MAKLFTYHHPSFGIFSPKPINKTQSFFLKGIWLYFKRGLLFRWNSIVQRGQIHHGKQNIGQEGVGFNGFNLARWCEDLKGRFPQLEAKHSQNGYDRFCKLWELSLVEHQRYADISVDYWDLTHDFNTTWRNIEDIAGLHSDLHFLQVVLKS